jgi:hypothetical protein
VEKRFLCGMYFKVSMRHNSARGFIDGYYRLVESYRNAEDKICYRTLLNVGFLDTSAVSAEQLDQLYMLNSLIPVKIC